MAIAEKKKAASGKRIIVEQYGSPIGRTQDQRGTLVGLGLNKIRRRNELEDSPAVRGMVNKVKHMVRIVES